MLIIIIIIIIIINNNFLKFSEQLYDGKLGTAACDVST